ncbi:MAG: EFR1 family ferrodoxin [Candidatus Omnitrophota bacterium]
MNAVIYYFSATGNSLIVARDIARGLDNADLVPISKASEAGSSPVYDTVGFVFPVYMFGLPLIVADFLKSVKIKPGAYVFSVATFGGLQGRAHSLAKTILRKRTVSLSAGFSVMMPGNYTPLYGAIAQEKQDEMFKRQDIKTRQIVDCVREKRTSALEEKPFLLNFLLYAILYKGGSSQIPLSAKGFWFTEACTRCGLCSKVCPVSNIVMQNEKPSWLTHCQHCMACLQWCPEEAIQYKKATFGKKRYHHPGVAAKDIMGQK